MIKSIIFDVGGVLIDNPWPGMRSHYTKNLNVDEEKFDNVYREKEEIFSIIKSLKERRYKISLLSNTEIPVMHFIMEQKYEDFDVFIFSCDVWDYKARF